MSQIPNLHEEIIIDILYCLPAKSLARFRSVSKLWLSILTHSKFIKTHLNINIKNEKLLVVFLSYSLHALSLNPQNDYISRKLNFPSNLDRNWYEIAGSCGGLVLALDRDEDPKGMFLINPTTSKYNKLPEIPMYLGRQPNTDVYGFGYDEYSDDFKVVILACYDDDFDHDDFYVAIDVYSLKANCWRRIEDSPFDYFCCEDGLGVLLHGAIHWSAHTADYSPIIAAFDLSTEKIVGLEVPDGDVDAIYPTNKLVVYDCCLCMIIQDDRTGIDVWMMKKYGVQESWIKLINVSNDFNILIPVSLVEDPGLVVSNRETGELEIFNVKEERFKSFVIDGARARFRDGWAFVESLVSPSLNC